jgi:hypothetical protein
MKWFREWIKNVLIDKIIDACIDMITDEKFINKYGDEAYEIGAKATSRLSVALGPHWNTTEPKIIDILGFLGARLKDGLLSDNGGK